MILRHKKKQARFSGGKPFAYLRVTGLRQEFLGMITDQDARREGYPHIPAYRKTWKRINGHWDPHMPVWVVDFELSTEVEYLAQRKGAA